MRLNYTPINSLLEICGICNAFAAAPPVHHQIVKATTGANFLDVLNKIRLINCEPDNKSMITAQERVGEPQAALFRKCIEKRVDWFNGQFLLWRRT